MVDLQLFLAKLLNLFEAVQVVVEEHLGVVDGILGAHEDEGDVALLPRDRGLGLIVPLDLDPDHA